MQDATDFEWDEPFGPGPTQVGPRAGLDRPEPGQAPEQVRVPAEATREDATRGDEPGAGSVPWAGVEEGWTIQEVEARQVRPGWWCYASDTTRFVEVTYVTMTTAGRGRTVFADLADGRTLALDERAVVLVRRPR